METLKTLRDQCLYLLDEAGDTGTTKTNIDNFINQAHQSRCVMKQWPFMLWDTPETFTTADGDQLYALHSEFMFPSYFFNRTKKKYLVESNSRQIEPSGVRWNEDVQGERFMLWGRTPVQNQPAAASTVRIVSSSASDTQSSKAITIKGVTASGVTSESLTPNGATLVTSTNSYSKILAVTKAAVWVGNMTMTSDSGAVTNLTLFPNELGRNYQQIYLLFDPDAADVIEYRFYRKPSQLTADNDIPDIPDPFSQILVWEAALMIAAYNNMAEEGRVKMWRERMLRWEDAMERTFFEGGSIAAEPRFIRSNFNEDAALFPRFNR